MKIKNKKLLITGIIGCLLYVTGDFLFAATIKEAAEYSNIGQNRIEKLLRAHGCPFLLCVGSKKLIKRKKFEEFIEQIMEI